MKTHDEKGLMKTILKWPPTCPQRQIFDGPISKSAYNTFLNTYTKFCAFITKYTIFLLCRPTILKDFVEAPNNNDVCTLCRCRFTSAC